MSSPSPEGDDAPTRAPDNSPTQPTSPLAGENNNNNTAPENQDPSSPTSEATSEAKADEIRLLEEARLEEETQTLEALHRRARHPLPTTTTTSSSPPLIIGAPLGNNLTPLEAATLLVSQWEAIHQQTLLTSPASAAAPILDSLTRARAQLASLQTSSSSSSSSSSSATTPINSLQSHKETSIAARVSLLESSLADSLFPAERANITAAIALYRASRVPYSHNWALIYAGHLVDFAPTYASFTADRQSRLDRYARLHGPGWLWFEPPLARAASSSSSPLFSSARRGTWLPETDTSYDMGHYSVTMSFRRMKNLVHRNRGGKRRRASDGDNNSNNNSNNPEWPLAPSDDETDGPLPPRSRPTTITTAIPRPPSALRRSRPTNHPNMASDPSAPTLHFRMLLDSGATLPMLYDRDATALGISRGTYAAVSRIAVETAGDALLSTWIYEMQVSIADTHTCAPLVSPTAPVWPAEDHALGGIVPVMIRPSPSPSSSPSFSAPSGSTGACARTVNNSTELLVVNEAEGRDYGRLSGLLPFKCCYVQSTPGLKTIWLGEDRKDVLGAHRMPGQMRWAPGSGRVCDPGHPRELWADACGGGGGGGGDPSTLRMAHERDTVGAEGGVLGMMDVEEKGWRGRSEVVVLDGDGVRTNYAVEPRLLPSQRGNKRQKRS